MMFRFCFHQSSGMDILAICDSSLVGKTLFAGDLCLLVTSAFYGAEEVGVDTIRSLLRMSVSLNLLGNDTVALALEEDVASLDDVTVIAGVKHVQVYHV